MFGLWPASKCEKAPVDLKISLANQKVSFAGPAKSLIRLMKFPNKNTPEQEESFVSPSGRPITCLHDALEGFHNSLPAGLTVVVG
jgi:hypothetical protein